MSENSNSLIELPYIENKNLNRSLKDFYQDSFDFSDNIFYTINFVN